MSSRYTRDPEGVRKPMGPPTFRRSPRIVPDFSRQEIVIPAPPSQQESSPNSVLLMVLPLMLIAGVMVAIGVFSHMVAMIWYSVPMILASGVASVIGYVAQQRKAKSRREEKERKYRSLLDKYESRLRQITKKQREIALLNNPPVGVCLEIVESLNRALWCRTPSDEDFLSLRIGVGSLPLWATVKLPEPQDPLNPSLLVSEAQRLVERYKFVSDIPVSLPLTQSGPVGIAGERDDVIRFTSALLIHLATHHAPSEVKIAVLYHREERNLWNWTRWLPHTWSDDGKLRFMGEGKTGTHRTLDALEQLFSMRQRRSNERHASGNVVELPRVVVVITDDRLLQNEPFSQKLLSEGSALGFYPVILAMRVKLLPKECVTWVKLENGKGVANIRKPGGTERFTFSPDLADVKTAQEFARLTAPIELQRSSQATIPSLVTLLDLFQVEKVEDLNIETRWRKNFRPTLSLATPIGVKAGGDILYLDLHEKAHGPNGLVAGMVGSGKTELLQTLVASLAVNYHPYMVSFVLVDYKGGGMASPFADIPHTLGVITNLQKGNLAERAITSFKVEMERRQKIFEDADVTHIDQYQALFCSGRVKEPLPYLVVIVDEFAEMKTEQPEVAKEFVRVARLGRSLGFRLILAMQKPAGIVDGQIEANTRFRLCLKVAQTEDSQAMLKRPDAAFLVDRGRAYFQVGANEIFEEFQVGWGGAPYDPFESVRKEKAIVKVNLDGSREVLYSPVRTETAENETQLKAVLSHIKEMAEKESLAPLESLWLPPLPEYIPLEKVRPDEGWDGRTWRKADTWMSPVVGLLDDPKNKRQVPFRVNLGKGEHLSVFGAPGYGKTVFLETLVTSLVLSHSPLDVNLYILDFGGTLLKLFEPLPHVGSVITADEEEKIRRLWQYIAGEIKNRKKLFGKEGVARLKEYRELTREKIPEIVVIIDNYPSFYKAYEIYQPQVENIARDGGSVGVHLVITANSAASIRFHLKSLITSSIALTLADTSEYMEIVGRTDGLIPEAIPGRGLVKGKPALEFQIAVPADNETDAGRTQRLRSLVREMKNAWKGEVASPIRTLPEIVSLSDIIGFALKNKSQLDGHLIAPLGMNVKDLSILEIDLLDYVGALILGRRRGGKTSLLRTWVTALSTFYSAEYVRFVILDSKKKELASLANLPHILAYNAEERQSEEVVRKLLTNGTSSLDSRFLVIVVDGALQRSDFGNVITDKTQAMLADIVRRDGGERVKLILSSDIDKFYRISDLYAVISGVSWTILLGHSKDSVIELNLPYEKKNKLLSAGEGYVVMELETIHAKFASLTGENGT